MELLRVPGESMEALPSFAARPRRQALRNFAPVAGDRLVKVPYIDI
jgi:hypothetical protein